MKWLTSFLMIVLLLSITQSQTLESVSFPFLGQVQPRHANEIQASPWSVGAETMGRDYLVYANWKEYLGPLGAKKARIQSGWAKTEKEKGVYDWAWMDEIVFDMASQGVEPWIDLCYGNPVYPGGGGITLRNKQLPDSAQALEGWVRYVKAIVARYKDVVDEWEVWNEPNYRIDDKVYANFLVLTAETVKSVQPDAKILGFALGSHVDFKYADKVLSHIAKWGKVHLIDQVTHHRHRPIPEENEHEIQLERVLDKYGEHLIARQGEAGCPSEYSEAFAMNNMPWSELTQSKHILRRMMTDWGRGKESCIFLIIDAKYMRDGNVIWNRKGLIRATEDKKVDYLKPAYHAMQHATSIFDSSLQTIDHYAFSTDSDRPLSLYGVENIYSGEQLVSIWFDDQIPAETNDFQYLEFIFYTGSFNEPVYVDLRTGEVYKIPEKNWSRKGSGYTFKDIPVYDSPILIADKSLILIQD
jgi:hypothetical protein